MSKKRFAEFKGEGPAGGKGPSVPLVLLCALLSGIALGVGFDGKTNGSAARLPISEIALEFPKSWEALRREAPKVLSPVRLGELPAWLPRTQEAGEEELSLSAKPVIAVIVENLGADEAAARRAIALPANVTLSFSPNPDASFALSQKARAEGHPVMVHLEMQGMARAKLQPMGLYPNLAPGEIARRVAWALTRVSGRDGAGNHLGSRFTASRNALVPVMQTLGAKNMFFLDSRTTQVSQAEYVARANDVLTGSRDVFLDSESSAGDVAERLARIETAAREQGSAIAIGHPHERTLAALKLWASTLEEKGLVLVPVRQVLERRARGTRQPLISTMFN